MTVKAYYKNKNPFTTDINQLAYSKTVQVPDGTDMKLLEYFAKEDTRQGFDFDRIEEIK